MAAVAGEELSSHVWGEAEVSSQEYGRGDVASMYFPACESLRILYSES